MKTRQSRFVHFFFTVSQKISLLVWVVEAECSVAIRLMRLSLHPGFSSHGCWIENKRSWATSVAWISRAQCLSPLSSDVNVTSNVLVQKKRRHRKSWKRQSNANEKAWWLKSWVQTSKIVVCRKWFVSKTASMVWKQTSSFIPLVLQEETNHQQSLVIEHETIKLDLKHWGCNLKVSKTVSKFKSQEGPLHWFWNWK